MPLLQWDILDTLLDELFQMYRRTPAIFFWELISGEIISPMAHVHTACSHSPYTALGDNGDQPPPQTIITLHALDHQNHLQPCIFQHLSIPWAWWGAASSEASPSSIIHSNWYAKV